MSEPLSGLFVICPACKKPDNVPTAYVEGVKSHIRPQWRSCECGEPLRLIQGEETPDGFRLSLGIALDEYLALPEDKRPV